MNPPLRATLKYLLEPPSGEFRIGAWATCCVPGWPARRRNATARPVSGVPVSRWRFRARPTGCGGRRLRRGEEAHCRTAGQSRRARSRSETVMLSRRGAPRKAKLGYNAPRWGCLDFSFLIGATLAGAGPPPFRLLCPRTAHRAVVHSRVGRLPERWHAGRPFLGHATVADAPRASDFGVRHVV